MTLLLQRVSMRNSWLIMLMQLLLPLQLRHKLKKPTWGWPHQLVQMVFNAIQMAEFSP
jgi:hypothetical protein